MCTQRTSIFIVDKDFTEIGVLKTVFLDAAVLLCTFHVINCVKIVTIEKTDKTVKIFKTMVYASADEIYTENKNAFLLASNGVRVRVNKQYGSLENQFLNN